MSVQRYDLHELTEPNALVPVQFVKLSKSTSCSCLLLANWLTIFSFEMLKLQVISILTNIDLRKSLSANRGTQKRVTWKFLRRKWNRLKFGFWRENETLASFWKKNRWKKIVTRLVFLVRARWLSFGLYYKIYNVVFMPSYRPKEVSVESIHRYQLSSVWWRKNDVVNYII